MAEPAKLHRLFFALWPDDAVRNEIARQFQQLPQYSLPGNKTLPSNLHLTLHFIGNVDQPVMARMQHVARTIQSDAFALTLTNPGYFSKPQVFWLGCSPVPDALASLYRQLAIALRPCGYEAEARPFSPHVTLMRKLREPGDVVPIESISWLVRSFSLIESISGSGGVTYQPLENYFLQ